MHVTMLKSKLHNALITGTDTRYEGSIVVDEALMDEVGLYEYEKVLVANVNTGGRFETYAIKGVIIFAFVSIPEEDVKTFSPRIVLLDGRNRVVQRSFAA
jgi:aspartate 1-decarboxylase